MTKQANTDGDLVATRTSAGTASTSTKAWSLADGACKTRDIDPAEARPRGLRGQDLLSTHFRAVVVSSLFVGLTQLERLDLVVEALLDKSNQINALELPCLSIIPAIGECTSRNSGMVWFPERVPKGFYPGPRASDRGREVSSEVVEDGWCDCDEGGHCASHQLF